MSVASLNLMIPDYIDKCPDILMELSEKDRQIITDIITRAKVSKKYNEETLYPEVGSLNKQTNGLMNRGQSTPLSSYIPDKDKIILREIISRLPEIDYDTEDDCF